MSITRELISTVLFRRHPFAVPLQNFVQRILRGPRPTSFVFADGPAKGMTFNCLTSEKVFFERHDYELPVRRMLGRTVKAGWTVYQVGANIGMWTLPLSHLVGASGFVVALEPSPVNFARLSENVSANNLKNVLLLQTAASDSEGQSTIAENGSMTRVGSGTVCVSLVTLDALNQPIPQLLLIDVEGHAPKVLQGATNILSRHPIVLLETHDQAEDDGAMNILGKFGYSAVPLFKSTAFPRNFVASV